MRNFRDIEADIDAVRTKVKETAEDADFNSGPLRDVMKVVGPMMLDQLRLMEDVLTFARFHDTFDKPEEDECSYEEKTLQGAINSKTKFVCKKHKAAALEPLEMQIFMNASDDQTAGETMTKLREAYRTYHGPCVAAV